MIHASIMHSYIASLSGSFLFQIKYEKKCQVFCLPFSNSEANVSFSSRDQPVSKCWLDKQWRRSKWKMDNLSLASPIILSFYASFFATQASTKYIIKLYCLELHSSTSLDLVIWPKISPGICNREKTIALQAS